MMDFFHDLYLRISYVRHIPFLFIQPQWEPNMSKYFQPIITLSFLQVYNNIELIKHSFVICIQIYNFPKHCNKVFYCICIWAFWAHQATQSYACRVFDLVCMLNEYILIWISPKQPSSKWGTIGVLQCRDLILSCTWVLM